MLRAVPKRAAHRKDVSLHRLRLDHAVGPYGFEQLIVRDQASGIFDQIRQNQKGLRAQQNALLRPGVATSPETLVQGIEPEGNKHFHRRSGSQTSNSTRDGVQCIALAVDSSARSPTATPAICAAIARGTIKCAKKATIGQDARKSNRASPDNPDGNMDNNCCTVRRVTLSQRVEYPQKR